MSFRVRFLFGLTAALVVAPPGSARAQIPPTPTPGGTPGGGMTSGTENVASPLPFPKRALLEDGQYVDVTNTPRPQNLNPTGANFSDCEHDLELTFPLILSGFQGGSGVQAWAGTQDCSQDANRGHGGSGVCWPVSPAPTALLYTSATSVTYTVYARDVMRYANTTFGGMAAPVYDPTWHSSAAGESACHVQQSDAAISLNIYFVPIRISGATSTGTPFVLTPFITDTVAPPPPTVNSIGFGDTLLTVQWTSPGDDPDIAGFAVWSDPPAAGTAGGGGACSCGGSPGAGSASSYVGNVGADGASLGYDASRVVCEDAAPDVESSTIDASAGDASDAGTPSDGASDAPGADAGHPALPAPIAMEEWSADAPNASDGPADAADADIDAAGDAGPADAGAQTDAMADSGDGATPGGDTEEAGLLDDGGLPPGCQNENVGGGGACNSYALTGNTFVVGGSTTSADGSASSAILPLALSDGGSTGTTGAAEAGVTLSGGGISEIPPQNKAGELDDRTATQMTLTGLVNGTTYVVVVTSVDGSGNVGPPSAPQCAVPVSVNDFWKTYKQAGGGASGCALESVGLPAQVPVLGAAAAMLLALLRRRRRKP